MGLEKEDGEKSCDSNDENPARIVVILSIVVLWSN
jgi:hypothetical protein